MGVCTPLKPPTPKVLLYADTPNEKIIEMDQIMEKGMGSSSW